MKILIVSHYFTPHHGGIENVAYNQAIALADQGHSVTVVSSAIPKAEQYDSGSFTVIRIPAWNFLENKLGVPYPLFSPSLYRTLKKEIKSADIIHAHGHVFMPSVLAARIASQHKKPLILTQHNTFIGYKSYTLRTVQKLADNILGKSTISRASAVICVSAATKDYVNHIFPVKSLVHYNGVDARRFKPAKNQAALRKSLELPIDKKICFTIRRITFKNGVDTMIEAAKILKDRQDILFVIGGKGPDLAEAKKLVIKKKLSNVILLGAVSEADLPKYYAASDIFILPSKKGEGFPLVILEALASGLPIIATRSGGHVEVIENSRYGFIVEPDQPKEIAAHIKEFVSDIHKLQNTKLGCRLFAELNLSWDKNVNDLVIEYKKALA